MKHIKKKYHIYMVIDGDKRLLTTTLLKSAPIKRQDHPSLYSLMEGIKIGIVFSNKEYKTLEFTYEEVK